MEFFNEADTWNSLHEYMLRNSHDFVNKLFKPSRHNTAVLNYALLNMHTRPSFEFVCKNVNSDDLTKIIKRDGMPIPFIIESEIEELREKASFNAKGQTIHFRDQYCYSEWVNKLIHQIEPSFTVCERQHVYQVKYVDNVTKRIKNICLTPHECDVYEIRLLVNGMDVVRNDGLSVLEDPAINNLINIYKYLNNPDHLILLCDVVQSNTPDKFMTPSEVFKIAKTIKESAMNGTTSIEVPDALKYVVTLCNYYKKGVTIEGLTTFISMMLDARSELDMKRLTLLNIYLKEYSQHFVQDRLEQDHSLVLINSITAPQINLNNTLISTSVPLDHIHVSLGKQIKLTNLYQ